MISSFKCRKGVFPMLFLLILSLQAHAQWTDLIKGKKIQDFEKLGSKATYEIVGNELIGKVAIINDNTFLATKEKYADFVLEYELFIDSDINTGVQIRSISDKNYRNGRVHGYQVEVDPSDRQFTGGIYDEQRRMWLYPPSRNPKSKGSFRFGKWNKFHVEAIGNEINTWVNGVHIARLYDDMTASGFIAFQVHGTTDQSLDGKLIRWKNVQIATSGLDAVTWSKDPEVEEISFLVNRLSPWEEAHGWKLLWDGKTTQGWRGAKLDGFPEKGWEIMEGALTVLATDGGESAGPGDIVTTKMYSNFILELEFKITEGANSGVKYFVDPALNKGQGSAIGCEFQILDDQRHPDAKMGVGGNRTLASLYDLIPAKNYSLEGRPKQFKGIDTWNQVRIVSNNGKVEHWLNGEKAVEYDRFSQMFEALVAYSKYRDWPNFGRWPEGHILLQDHGNQVSFRSIKIKEL